MVALLCATSFSVNATLIAQDLTLSSSVGLLNYQNDYADAFSSPEDGAQIYQIGVDTIPNSLIDKSTTTSDSLGLVKSTNLTSFFGITDTVNSNNASGEVEAIWAFDISGFTELMFSIDIAAMGDFEINDIFNIDFQIDNGDWVSIFTGIADESGVQSYRLENGSDLVYNDPMTVDGTVLNNNFTQFSQSLAGDGDVLGVRLSATTNGGTEAMAFQNMLINGAAQQSLAVVVSEPMHLFVLSLFLLLTGRKWL